MSPTERPTRKQLQLIRDSLFAATGTMITDEQALKTWVEIKNRGGWILAREGLLASSRRGHDARR